MPTHDTTLSQSFAGVFSHEARAAYKASKGQKWSQVAPLRGANKEKEEGFSLRQAQLSNDGCERLQSASP